MAGATLKRATNKVVIGGTDPVLEEMNIETATNIYGGRLVMKGTHVDDIVLNTGQTPLGWLGYEQCNVEDKPETKATIYAAGAQAPLLKGSGFILDALAVDTSGEAIVKGDKLIPTATLGGVKKATTADASTNTVVAIAEENVTLPAGGSVAILVRRMI